MAADGSRLGWDKAHSLKADGQQALLSTAWVSCGESLVGGLVSGPGATPATSTSAGREYLVRRLLENSSTSSEELTGGAGHPALHGGRCESCASASGRSFWKSSCQRDLVLSVGDSSYFY